MCVVCLCVCLRVYRVCTCVRLCVSCMYRVWTCICLCVSCVDVCRVHVCVYVVRSDGRTK